MRERRIAAFEPAIETNAAFVFGHELSVFGHL
jgi:hypothetical protein